MNSFISTLYKLCLSVNFEKLGSGLEGPLLAGFCLLHIPVFYDSYVRFLPQSRHYLVLTKEQEGGALLAAAGHDFVSTINGRSEGTREL
jgi:hypothetical protein